MPCHALGAKRIHQADVLALGQQAFVAQRSHVAHGFRFVVISVVLGLRITNSFDPLLRACLGVVVMVGFLGLFSVQFGCQSSLPF